MSASALPKHRRIFETLQREILAQKYDPAARLPSEAELVRRFRASRPTVIRAVRDLQALGLVDRRAGSGTYLRAAGAVSSKRLGLIVSGLGNTEILEPICAELGRAAEAAGHTLLWGGASTHDFSAAQAEALCQEFIAQRVAGVFFAPLEHPDDRAAVNARIAAALAAAHIPAVLLDRDLGAFPDRSALDLVAIDNFAAGVTLATHLVAQAKRIVFVAKPRYPATTDLRLAGCREALARSGKAATPLRVCIGDPEEAGFVQQIMADGVDGVICSNDLTAAQLAQTFARLGVAIPRDLRLAGFDDVRYATLLSPPLTTMRQPCRALAQTALRAMLERVGCPGAAGAPDSAAC